MRAELLKDVTRIVVKLGTGVLTDSRKQPDLAQMEQLVAQIAEQRQAGREMVLVSSGAVGAGMGALGFERRPSELAELQACAAVGQSRLMAIYEKLFGAHGLSVAQILLTHDDLQHHERHLNARNTLVTLLAHGVVPIINENDVVSFTELKFGDNDTLSALVASLLPADLLLILTTVDGVLENFGKANPRTIPLIERVDEALEQKAGGTDSATAVGGMASKIQAAKIVIRSGIPLVIASGRKKRVMARVLAWRRGRHALCAATDQAQGAQAVDRILSPSQGRAVCGPRRAEGAARRGKSLLPPGITRCEGEFAAGEVVRICDKDGTEFARGIAGFGATRNQGQETAAGGGGASGQPGDIVRDGKYGKDESNGSVRQ